MLIKAVPFWLYVLVWLPTHAQVTPSLRGLAPTPEAPTPLREPSAAPVATETRQPTASSKTPASSSSSPDFMMKLEEQWKHLRHQAKPVVERATSMMHLSFHRTKEAISQMEPWQAVLVVILISVLGLALLAAILKCAWTLCKVACCPCLALVRSHRNRRQEKRILRLLPGVTSAHPFKTPKHGY